MVAEDAPSEHSASSRSTGGSTCDGSSPPPIIAVRYSADRIVFTEDDNFVAWI